MELNEDSDKPSRKDPTPRSPISTKSQSPPKRAKNAYALVKLETDNNNNRPVPFLQMMQNLTTNKKKNGQNKLAKQQLDLTQQFFNLGLIQYTCNLLNSNSQTADSQFQGESFFK
jgi:hypothetical protein